MFRYLYIKSKYGSYLRNEHGIKKFAEMSVGQLVRRVAKKSAFYREMNENLLVEKANLRLRQEELHEGQMLDPGEFFSIRRRLWANTFILTSVIVTAIFLVYISVTAFLTDITVTVEALEWIVSGLLAVVLIGGGVIITERLIEALVPGRSPRTAELRTVNHSVAPLWIALLVGIELTLLGISEARASLLSTAQDSTILYFGFIILVMMLPVMAGAIRWDAMRYIDFYKATQALRQIESRLAQIDSILRQNEEYESNFYKIKSIQYWDLVNDFKTVKDNFNIRKGIQEALNGHFAQTYDTFQAEANKRYSLDIRDITSKSIRKLELVNKSGGKLGHQLQNRRYQNEATDGSADIDNPDVYLSPKPIR